MKNKEWAEALFDTAFAGPTRDISKEKLARMVDKIREESAAVLSAEAMRLLGSRDREDVESIARAAKLVRDHAAEQAE